MTGDQSQQLEQSKRYGEVVAKAWIDPAFKARLLAEPETVAREEGLEVAAGTTLRAIEVGARQTYIVLPSSAEQPAADMPAPWAQLYEKTADPAYVARLKAEPAAALAEIGVELPAGHAVMVVEPSDTEGYLWVPPMPEGLAAETIDDDVAGYFSCCSGCQGCYGPPPPPPPSRPVLQISAVNSAQLLHTQIGPPPPVVVPGFGGWPSHWG